MKKKMQTGGIAGNKMMPMASMPQMAKKGAKVITKAKKGGSFPDFSGDGKITEKDVLMGKGVIPKKSKKAMYGKTMKAESGAKMSMKKMSIAMEVVT